MSLNTGSKISAVVCSVMVIIGLAAVRHPGQLRTSRRGQAFIAQAEACRRVPYRCFAGRATVGIGSTGDVVMTKRYTDDEIADRWFSDMYTAETCVNRYFNGRLMPQFPFEAMTSAALNVGCTDLRWNKKHHHVTQIYREAQTQHWTAMCHHLPDFRYSAGHPVLLKRRLREEAWCLQH
ncbi:lysozyme [Salmonella enterica]|nr:lysozyme [Salmonella enterica]